MTGRSHYDVLGVPPSAPPDVIRDTYRRLAREYHPDRTVGSAAGADRMPQINEAYRVLSDPGRKAVYDAELRGSVSRSQRPADTGVNVGDEVPDYRFEHPPGPARVPWRSLLFFSGIAIIVILVLAQFQDPPGPAEVDNILRNGDCAQIQPNNDAREVACTGEAGEFVVRQFIAFDRACPNGWEPHRDRQGMGVACLEPRPA